MPFVYGVSLQHERGLDPNNEKIWTDGMGKTCTDLMNMGTHGQVTEWCKRYDHRFENQVSSRWPCDKSVRGNPHLPSTRMGTPCFFCLLRVKQTMHFMMMIISSSMAGIQQCWHTQNIYKENSCCNSPNLTLPDKYLFPGFAERFHQRAAVGWKTSAPIDWTSKTSVISDTLSMYIAHRLPTSSEKVAFAAMDVPAIVKTLGYKESTLALKGAADMKEGGDFTFGKAIWVFGGGLAIEACMAFVRAGGHCYFASRTQEKQAKMMQSIRDTTLDADKQWSTAKLWTTVTDEQASRIYMQTVDGRIETEVLEYLMLTFADAAYKSLIPAGAYLAMGSQRLAPTYNIASPATVHDDIAGHPTYLNNSNSFAFPSHSAVHYYANLFVVKAFRTLFMVRNGIAYDETGSPLPGFDLELAATAMRDFTIVFTGSHVTLWDMAQWNDVKDTYNPVLQPAVDAEYILAKQQTEAVRLAAKTPFAPGAGFTFKTSTVHPIGCYTEWVVGSTSIVNWWLIFHGMKKETSLEQAGDVGRYVSTMNVDHNLLPANAETVGNGIANFTAYWNSPEGIAIRAAPPPTGFGGADTDTVVDLLVMSISEAFCSPGTSPGECVLNLTTNRDEHVFPYTYLPRGARIKDGKYQTNDYLFLSFMKFFMLGDLIPPEVIYIVNDILSSCVSQFRDEPFCTLSGDEKVLMNSLTPAVAAPLGLKISPITPPFVGGFAAAKMVAYGIDNLQSYQYGFVGTHLSSVAIGTKFFGDPTFDPFQFSYLATGDSNQDSDLLSLMLDASSSSQSSRRFVAETTLTSVEWH